jgi:amino acid transporter
VVVALLNVIAVLLVGLCFLIYRRARRDRPVPRQPRRVSPFALEAAATGFAVLSIVLGVAVKVLR